MVRSLLQAGADVDVQRDDGRTPLHYAAQRAGPEVVSALLDAGADTRVLDARGRSPCELADGNEELEGSAALARLCPQQRLRAPLRLLDDI
ncbi:ankyrin repeat domain-containing protein [Candidatus Palauibacter sp.]|uniref:ankyrin repeat domain-containing protein n=1 Tax=Candidatus Palauibacter sp. TaxID=3101350 RepID=UPI003AF2A7C1